MALRVPDPDELRRTLVDMGWAWTTSMVGLHYFSKEAQDRAAATVGGPFLDGEIRRASFAAVGPHALATMTGGRDGYGASPIPTSRAHG